MEHGDIPSVMAIERASFPCPWHESTFRGEIQNRPISHPLVVVHATLNQVIGYLIYWKFGEEAQVNNIAIHPDFRRLGIGEELLKHIIEELRFQGVKLLTLEVRPSNTGAIQLYKKLGFRLIGVRKGYYTFPPEDAFVLALHM